MDSATAETPPHAVILSGPLFYQPHITALYGGYKRTAFRLDLQMWVRDAWQQ